MPTPATGFFGGLAKGIFGTMAENEERQRKEDFHKKEQTLSYLTGLMDQTTPETRPILMNQISQVMGLKGKQRGVWDMLTGGGRQDYSDALGAKLDEITGNVMGPAAYEQRKPILPMPGETGLSPITPGRLDTRTGQEIVLMDPRADRLAQIREQYGAMKEAGLDRLEFQSTQRAALQEDAQKHSKEIEEVKQYNRAFGPVYKQAATIAASKGKPKFDEEDLTEAAQQIATLGGLNVDKLKAQIGLSQAKKLEAEANAQAAGLGTGDPFAGMKPGERARFDQSQQQNAAVPYGQWQKAYAEVQKIDPEQTTLRTELARLDPETGLPVQGQPRYSFDETQGTYVGPNGQAPSYISASVKAKIAKLKELEAQKQSLRATLQSTSQVLKAQFPDYYNVKDEWTVTPSSGFGGVASSGAPRTGTTYDATTRPGANIADMIDVKGSEARPWTNYKKDQIVSIDGKKYKVDSVTPPTEDRPFGSYVLKAIR